mmetsp:Transcript_15348/g.39000  ORF Transcript_15348/g.39000 Transcript_15348/m.39000 type:complete len:219 (-) Transcript_15348:8-664(-)
MAACGISGVFLSQTENLPRRMRQPQVGRATSGALKNHSPGRPAPTMQRRNTSRCLATAQAQAAQATRAAHAPQALVAQATAAAGRSLSSLRTQQKAAAAASPQNPAPMAGKGSAGGRREVEKVRTLREVSMAVVAVQRLSARGPQASRERPGPLAAARAAYKSHIGAVQRSQHFTQSMLQKMDFLCEDLVSCSTSCGSDSPSMSSSTSCGSFSPRESA